MDNPYLDNAYAVLYALDYIAEDADVPQCVRHAAESARVLQEILIQDLTTAIAVEHDPTLMLMPKQLLLDIA